MQKRIRVVAVVGLACALGIGWALGSPRVQQPPLEIPLYEGAQIEFEVQLSAQEMPKGLAEFAQALSVLKVAGYQLEPSVPLADFYDQAFREWRRIAWHRSEGTDSFFRIFAKDRSYVFISSSSRYEDDTLLIAIAQADETPVDVPVVEGAELRWEIVLTNKDLLEYLKRWFTDLLRDPRTSYLFQTSSRLTPSEPFGISWLAWLGSSMGDMIFRLMEDLSELRAIVYKVEGEKALDILSFYEQQFSDWQRTLWIKPEESGSVRVFTRGSAEGLQELVALGTMGPIFGEGDTVVFVLRARR